MVRVVSFKDLPTTDLLVDAVYEGAPGGQLSGEALSKVLPGTGNLGGFRASGRGDDKKFVVLYTSGEDQDWPDKLDNSTGQFVYFGDNKTPGHELHDTDRGGNRILRRAFDLLHATPANRALIPPFFIFQKYPTAVSARSVQFKGLAVPGFTGLPATSDLVAVWKTTKGQRFQNYQATFTVLDTEIISRAWLNDLAAGNSFTANAPAAWADWVSNGRYRPLAAESTTVIRDVATQMPDTVQKSAMLEVVWQHFKDAPRAFEAFAARVFQMHDPRVIIDEVTRASVDGGRDAIGRYLLGLSEDPVYAEFSLEAKCYRPPLNGASANTIGVKEVARLISRIRHREFGVLVTTSVIGRQAYEEVREDRHPIIFLSGKDITEILTASGFNTPETVKELLAREFEIPGGRN
ncbi:Restriction endonuclease [Lutimaribacter pacificus]|uniref:Restriction endonuclease n=1 Tax=Lutimaribacter pacificus TaxID=391948 RepID=A0A1H0P0S4_9RHOB|nr:restriction endonuclease [Lutimaribacter pacificus]SDO98657.1 Restriction endonuclease [Lutimaribacter pacificus]SHK97882.1 Restriction endonuclease [Lutimaribacter pacificus]